MSSKHSKDVEMIRIELPVNATIQNAILMNQISIHAIALLLNKGRKTSFYLEFFFVINMFMYAYSNYIYHGLMDESCFSGAISESESAMKSFDLKWNRRKNVVIKTKFSSGNNDNLLTNFGL